SFFLARLPKRYSAVHRYRCLRSAPRHPTACIPARAFVVFFSRRTSHPIPWPHGLTRSLSHRKTRRGLSCSTLHLRPMTRRSSAKTPTASLLARLNALLERDAGLWCHPEAAVEYGDPGTRILETAKERAVDLIVLGIRNTADHLGAATHLERATAHKVVAHARCPVLTVRE